MSVQCYEFYLSVTHSDTASYGDIRNSYGNLEDKNELVQLFSEVLERRQILSLEKE